MLSVSSVYNFDDGMINKCGAVGRMRIGRWNRTTWRKLAPVPQQIVHVLTLYQSQVATLGSRWLTSRAVAHPPWLRFEPGKCQIQVVMLAHWIIHGVIVFTALRGSGWTACCRGETEGHSRTCESSARCSESLDQCGFIWQPDSWPEHNCHSAQEWKQSAAGSFEDPLRKRHFSQGMYPSLSPFKFKESMRNVMFRDRFQVKIAK
jgi:hypothetical protein